MIATMLLFVGGMLASSVTNYGHEPYGAPSPLDVAVSPATGLIYVAQTEPGQVVALDPDFKPTGWSLPAPNVTGVDVSPTDQLAVVTGGANGVLFVATAGGAEAWRVGGPAAPLFEDAWGVTWGPAGNLFVFDAGAGRVRVFDPQGTQLFDFGDYTWTRSYHSKKQNRRIEERVDEQLYRPCRGAFLPDGRLIVADYDGPIIDPELNRRGGMFSVWQVDVAAREARFQKFIPPTNPYPDFKAGGVCVERMTGRIYTVESDFPLTDHDFVRVHDSVDEAPRFATNYFPYRHLTHPRGVALSRAGDVIVAEADKGEVFTVPRQIFDTPAGEPNPLEWPKVLRIPVCEQRRAVIEYTTLEPVPCRVQFSDIGVAWYDYPEPPPADALREITGEALDHARQPLPAGEPSRFHRAELTGLKPGHRYVFRYLLTNRAYPQPQWSEPQLVTTRPPDQEAQYLDAEVIVLLFTNLVTPPADGVTPVPADPGPMTAEQIAGVKDRLEYARRFYWINSRCKFNVRFTYVIDTERYTPGPVHNWGYWPHDDHQKIDAILEKNGVPHKDVAGLCAVYGYRHWDANQGQWVLSGSGGNTWGSCHDGSAINAINAGGDTCWLFVHEYGHSMGINYQYSGQVYHFNHFHWNWLPTDYGAHYDGMAAICREFKDVAYWANKYGRIVTTPDADGDGLPTSDPRCPVDERRFGSDGLKPDTDGDGLTDLEELMTTQGLASYDLAFDMRQVQPVFEPDPTKTDTDEDGVRDGDDRYPLAPWTMTLHEAADIKIDGEIASAEWPWRGFKRVMEDPAIQGDLRLAWDRRHLYVGLRQKIVPGEDVPARIYMELDANNDGFTVGADNLELRFDPQPGGQVKVHTKYNDTIIRLKPRWVDNTLPSPADVLAQWSRVADEYHLEIALPQTPDAGLELTRWEELGVMFQLTPDGGQTLRLYEPQTHFDVTLR